LLLPHCCVLPSPCHCSTCNPPHEQLLMRLGAGGVLSCVPSFLPIVVLPSSFLSCRCPIVVLPSLFPSLLSHHHSPVIVLPLLCPCLLLSLFHLQSTPQAVAHEAGGGWCVIVCCFLFVTAPIPVVIHLVSRGSQWWWGGTVNGVILLLIKTLVS
jgi:hypothetical protein